MSRRALLLSVVVLAGCGMAPMSPGADPPKVVLRAEAEIERETLTLTYWLANSADQPVMYRVQQEPYIVLGAGGAVEISMRRVVPPPWTAVEVPHPPVAMRVLAPGEQGFGVIRLHLPLSGRPAPSSGDLSNDGLRFCLGVAVVPEPLPEPPRVTPPGFDGVAAEGRSLVLGQFARDHVYCVRLDPLTGTVSRQPSAVSRQPSAVSRQPGGRQPRMPECGPVLKS